MGARPRPSRRAPSQWGRVPECRRRSAGRCVVATRGKLAARSSLPVRSGRADPFRTGSHRRQEPRGTRSPPGRTGVRGPDWVRGAGEERVLKHAQFAAARTPTSLSQPRGGAGRLLRLEERLGGKETGAGCGAPPAPRRRRVTPGRGLAGVHQPSRAAAAPRGPGLPSSRGP